MGGFTSRIDSWQEKRQIMSGLTEKAERGELSEEELSAAIRIECDPIGNDDRSESVGAEWIREKPDLFAKTVKDPAAYLRAHQDVPRTTSELVRHPKVLMTIASREERLAFVTEHCRGNQYAHWWWIEPVLKAEITRAEVAEIMATGIEGCKPFEKHSGGCCANDNVAQIFLSDAWKDNGGLIYWDFFTPERLEQIVKVAALKAPPVALEIWDELVKRFGATIAEEVVTIALDNIQSFEGYLDMSPLKKLPLAIRIRVLQKFTCPKRALGFARLTTSILDLVALTLGQMTDEEEKIALFETLKPEIEKLGASQLWRWRLKAKDVPEFFWPFIREVSEKAGFITGTLEQTEHKGRPQFGMIHDHNAFVADRFKPFYDPVDEYRPLKAGDVVGLYADERHMKWLSRYGKGGVYAVTFIVLSRKPSTD